MTVIETDEKKIAKSGGSAVLYLSNNAKKYIGEGDLVRYQLILEDDMVKIVAAKKLFSFTLKEIRDLAKDHGFGIEYDKTLDSVQIFDAKKNNLALTYTKNLSEITSPANITVSLKLTDIDYETYKTVSKQAVSLKPSYNAITRFEGDVDTIKVLKEPERYKVKMAEAFELLKKRGSKIGLSVVIRLDNMKNNLDQVRSSLEKLSALDSKSASK